MKSAFSIIDNDDQISIRYNNLYVINNRLTYVTNNKDIIPPYVNKWTNINGWRPEIKVFSSELEINDLATNNINETIDLAILTDNFWYGNIGHALFDGLYPGYLAAVKFGYTNEPFTYITDNWSNTHVKAHEAILHFSGADKILSYPKLSNGLYIKTLITGTGRTGNRVINENYTLYGEKEYKALSLFKNRMAINCGTVPDKAVNSKIKAIIINNKRYSSKELKNIFESIDVINRLYENQVELRFLDWYQIKSFSDQIKYLQDIDLHITGPGTGMMYMPFLKKGAVNINLGYMERTQTNTARPNIKIANASKEDYIFPGWMEQSVCAAADYVSTLYYDRYTYNDIEVEPLTRLISKGIYLLKENIVVKDNHNIDAKIFIEYCKRTPYARQICDHLTNLAFFIELFVNEHPSAMQHPNIDIKLLRSIKTEFSLDEKYAIKL
jgi:hypothetical protein